MEADPLHFHHLEMKWDPTLISILHIQCLYGLEGLFVIVLRAGFFLLCGEIFWKGWGSHPCSLFKLPFGRVSVFINAIAALTASLSGSSSCNCPSRSSSAASLSHHKDRTLPTVRFNDRILKQSIERRMNPEGLPLSGPWDVSMFDSHTPDHAATAHPFCPVTPARHEVTVPNLPLRNCWISVGLLSSSG